MKRRTLLFASLVAIGTAGALFFSSKKSAKILSKFEVSKTEAQWRKILTPEQLLVVLRRSCFYWDLHMEFYCI